MATTATATTTVTTSVLPKMSTAASYGDWRDDFYANGYAVIKGAISPEKAQYYQQKAFDWLTSFGTDLDITNPETWLSKNLPVQSKINTFSAYAVAHEKFMWDARTEPGVLDAFAKLWNTEELLVSFDSLNVTFPNRKDKPRKAAWPHVDQSPMRGSGLHCVQGIINLSNAGPEDGGLVVYPGSSQLLDEFFTTQTDKATWEKRDVFMFSDEQLQWYYDRGVKPHKVCAKPGDLILWDSRTVHWGAEPSEKSNTIRTVIYAAYAPAALATPEALKTKAKVFQHWEGTTHWPHDNIVFRNTVAILDDGTPDPRQRAEPVEKPDMSDKLLKLAGVIPY